MNNSPSIRDIIALQAWTDTLYAEVMNCLDYYGHAPDCYLYRCPDDPDVKLGIGCDCWRSRFKKIAAQFMAPPNVADAAAENAENQSEDHLGPITQEDHLMFAREIAHDTPWDEAFNVLLAARRYAKARALSHNLRNSKPKPWPKSRRSPK